MGGFSLFPSIFCASTTSGCLGFLIFTLPFFRCRCPSLLPSPYRLPFPFIIAYDDGINIHCAASSSVDLPGLLNDIPLLDYCCGLGLGHCFWGGLRLRGLGGLGCLFGCRSLRLWFFLGCFLRGGLVRGCFGLGCRWWGCFGLGCRWWGCFWGGYYRSGEWNRRDLANFLCLCFGSQYIGRSSSDWSILQICYTDFYYNLLT